MYLNVDCVGIESVCKMIQQTQLKRFIIYRQGAGKGSTPVYDCSGSANNASALKLFRDWAVNAISFNPNHSLCYDLLLFNQEGEDNEESRKSGKIRFSFALNNAFGQQTPSNTSPPIDVATEIQKGIEIAMLKFENQNLKKQLKEAEEEEEKEEEPESDLASKIFGFMMGGQQQSPHMSGDDLQEEMEAEEKIKQQFTPQEIEVKKANVKKAMAVLWKHNKNLDLDLLRLSKMAQSNNLLFRMTIQKLRDMVKL